MRSDRGIGPGDRAVPAVVAKDSARRAAADAKSGRDPPDAPGNDARGDRGGSLFGVLGRVAAIALAVLSLASLAFAALLLATGRGLDAHEDWARVTAVVVSTAVTVGSSGLVLSTRGWWRVLMLLLLAGALYALVASARGYG